MAKRTQKKPITSAEAGKLRWRGTTKAQRSEIARAAITARWAKEKAKEA